MAPQPTASQPQAAMQMNAMNPPAATNKQADPESQCTHKHKESFISRLRGGGAAKDCFMGAIDCFLCFEGCRACCDCFADIICCPCEMCC